MTSRAESPPPPIRHRLNSYDKKGHMSPIRTRLNSRDMSQNTPNRSRINSRDFPRSYSGQFGEAGDDLLPFEISRKMHTDWLEDGGLLLMCCYVGGIFVVEILALAVLETLDNNSWPIYWSWTFTNAFHLLVTTIYLHWMKGSLFDEHGEMAALTLWEQLEGRFKTTTVKRVLFLVPTVLCYAACYFSSYDYTVSLMNVFLWSVAVVMKLPFMNGVRLFGINKTSGIDDFRAKKD